jgi:hypothetical protein
MERQADLRQEDLEVFATHVLIRSVPNFLKSGTACAAWLGVHSLEDIIVVLGLKVHLLLLCQLTGEPRNDG